MAQLLIELKERRRGPILDKTAKHYWCTFTAPRDTTSGIPARGDAHPVNASALLVSQPEARIVGSAIEYTAHYIEEQAYGA